MKLKKALALVMAAAMTFSLAGCGSSDDSASTPADDTSTADTSSDDSAATDTATEDASTEEISIHPMTTRPRLLYSSNGCLKSLAGHTEKDAIQL